MKLNDRKESSMKYIPKTKHIIRPVGNSDKFKKEENDTFLRLVLALNLNLIRNILKYRELFRLKMRLPILIKRDFNKKPHFLAGIGKKVTF